MTHADNPDVNPPPGSASASAMPRTFVGFGFGAIQAGLFACEALRSKNFTRVVIAEVVPSIVDAVRAEGGYFGLNIAHADRIESISLGPVELENPATAQDHERLLEAIAEAAEIATAVPSVALYNLADENSIHKLLAAGLRRRAGKPCVVYTAENHQRAAEILSDAVLGEIPADERDEVSRCTRFLNTVIGKMSAVIDDAERVRTQDLKPVTATDGRAFLVEAFNHILISAVEFPADMSFRRGLGEFEEKKSLHPFEDAKLYGHNAIHALAAYLAAWLGLERLEELRQVPGAMDFLRRAFLDEAGEALVRRWSGSDPLFTPEGFQGYVDDLLERMVNPFLGDLVERVTRDPKRKLAWEDRLVGSLRLAVEEGLQPWRLGLGAAAALAGLDAGVLGDAAVQDWQRARRILEEIWRPSCPDSSEASRVARLVEKGLTGLATPRGTKSDLFLELESYES